MTPFCGLVVLPHQWGTVRVVGSTDTPPPIVVVVGSNAEALIGFAMGTNTYFQNANPNGSISYDGYFHPEDEALLPWFMRLPSNATGSELNQSAVGGRYTFMGDLNPFPGFRQPATGC